MSNSMYGILWAMTESEGFRIDWNTLELQRVGTAGGEEWGADTAASVYPVSNIHC